MAVKSSKSYRTIAVKSANSYGTIAIKSPKRCETIAVKSPKRCETIAYNISETLQKNFMQCCTGAVLGRFQQHLRNITCNHPATECAVCVTLMLPLIFLLEGLRVSFLCLGE